jgi:tRNA-2-methylthio-N6-dimethylallyladenosine synthase
MKLYVQTWGCQMNQLDSARIVQLMKSADYEPTDSVDDADLIILNTCSVRDKAEQKVYSALGRWRPLKEEKGVILGVGGCVAQQEGEAIFSRAPAVDFVLGTQSLPTLPDIVRRLLDGESRVVEIGRHPGNLDIPPEQIDRIPGVKAYITIMEGCDNFCSFCVVPFTRGRERCRTVAQIVGEAESLADAGFREIQLLGQNVNSYRDPKDGRGFAALTDAVGAVTGIRRIRFTSPHPKDFSEALMERFAAGGALMPHMHLPAQSGSTSVLERMRRGYSREDFLELVRRARERAPGLALSTDLIVGFCGETPREFEDTLTLLDEVRFSSVYSFKYSERPHTLASKRLPDDVPDPDKTERLIALQSRQREIQLSLHRSLVGRTVEVLIEGPSRKGGQLAGRGPDNRIVNFEGPLDAIGSFAEVTITGFGPNSLLGELAGSPEAHHAHRESAAPVGEWDLRGSETALPVIQNHGPAPMLAEDGAGMCDATRN